MKCTNCENKKELKKQFVTIKYDECGLDNVTLIGATQYKCDACGETYTKYGNIHQVHSLIKDSILEKPTLLNGAEIKFLRKYMGYSTQYFAMILGVQIRTVQRWEANESISLQIDHSIRLAVASKEPNRDYNLHDMLLQKDKLKSYKRMLINLTPKVPTVSYA